MKVFLDTADVEAIRRAQGTGLLDGVTTNPSKIIETGRNFHEVIQEICSIVTGPVSAEALRSQSGKGPQMARLIRNCIRNAR